MYCLLDRVPEDFDHMFPLCCSGVNLGAANKLVHGNCSSPSSNKSITNMLILLSAMLETAKSESNAMKECRLETGLLVKSLKIFLYVNASVHP